MDECYARAEKILQDNIDKLHLVAGQLMENETLEAEEFAALMDPEKASEQEEGSDPNREMRHFR